VNNRTSLIILGIALAGVLIYFMSSGVQPDKSPVAPEKSASPVPRIPPVIAEPSLQEEQPLTREHIDSTTSAPQQQAPALEPEIREALGNMLNTSSEGLVEETRNGVTSVNLQGRFQTAPVATIDADGNVQITDYSHLPRASTPP